MTDKEPSKNLHKIIGLMGVEIFAIRDSYEKNKKLTEGESTSLYLLNQFLENYRNLFNIKK